MFTVVIPAFEEAETIGAAVRSVAAVAGNEVIVVDDGSRDATAAEARRAGARVIELGRNRGKGYALEAGVRASRHDLLVFLDADVTGMDEEKLLSLVRPVRNGAVMCVGVRHAVFHHMNRSLRWLPVIAKLSGQRCMRRQVWQAARRHCRGYRVEVALNYFASRLGEIEYIHLPGLSHRIKEEKRGLVPGMQQRLKMVADIVTGTVAVRLGRSARR